MIERVCVDVCVEDCDGRRGMGVDRTCAWAGVLVAARTAWLPPDEDCATTC